VDRITVSVRVAGDQLDPDVVSRALGTAPTFAARKGERRPSGGRDVFQRTGVWFVEFQGAPEEWTLDEAIAALLDRLPADIAVWDEVAAQYGLDVFCGLYLRSWSRGFALPPGCSVSPSGISNSTLISTASRPATRQPNVRWSCRSDRHQVVHLATP